MTFNAHRKTVLALYQQLLRESNQFDTYIYRKYALRRVRDHFRQNKTLTDEKQIQQLITDGQNSLQMIRRQVIINKLYKDDKLVVEGLGK